MEHKEQQQRNRVIDVLAMAVICVGLSMLYILFVRKGEKSMDELTPEELIELRTKMEKEEKYELCQKITDILEKKK